MALIVSILVLVISYFVFSSCQLLDVFQFYSFDEDHQGAVKVELSNKISYEKGFTICFRMKFKAWNPKCLIKVEPFESQSYSYKYFNGFSMGIFGIIDDFQWENPLAYFNEWQSLCFIYDAVKSNMTAALNGNFYKTSANVLAALKNISVTTLGPILKIGKCQKNFLQGDFTDLNIWSQPLSDELIKTFASGCVDKMFSLTNPDVAAWDQRTYYAEEFVTNYTMTRKDLCTPKVLPMTNRILKIFKKKMPFDDAWRLCDVLGGDMFLPQDELDLNSSLKFLNGSAKGPKNCDAKFWMPIRNKVEDLFVWRRFDKGSYVTSNSLFLPWGIGEPTHEEGVTCVLVNRALTYLNEDCSWSFCTACHFKDIPTFYFKGFCEDEEKIDTHYVMLKESIVDDTFELLGLEGLTKVAYFEDEATWKLIQVENNQTLGYLNKQNGDHESVHGILQNYPFGLREWSLTEHCNLKMDNFTKKLLFTRCGSGQFSCHDGTCLTDSVRCDGIDDCHDASDENDCEVVKIPKDSYKHENPPISSDKTTQINISIVVTYIGSFDPKAMTFMVGFEARLEWYDRRLRFSNLKKSQAGVKVDESQKQAIWIPRILFANSLESLIMIVDDQTHLLVKKYENPLPEDPTEIYGNKYFAGAKNPIEYARYFLSTFICYYSFEKFPFDNQECEIQMESPQYFSNRIMLYPLNITGNLSKLISTEYKVTNIRYRLESNESQIAVIISLQRGYGYHLSTSYMPTLTLIVVVECTLFFKPEQLEVATGFSLTIMLVLYTYIQGIYSDIPMTSYVKFIDCWLMFCLLTPIAIFLTEVAWLMNFYSRKKKTEAKRSWESNGKLIVPFQKSVQIIFISMTSVFVLAYSFMAFKFYY